MGGATREQPFGPFTADLGFEMEFPTPDEVICRVRLGPRHINRAGVVHGGLVFTLGDTAMGATVHLVDNPGGGTFLSSDVQIRYVRALTSGTIYTRCVIEARTRNTRVVSCKVHREPDDEIVALMTAQFRRRV